MADKSEQDILYAASEYDRVTVEHASEDLIFALDDGDFQPTYANAKAVLKALKSARYFDLLVKVAEAYRRTDQLAGRLTSLLVQGLIELKDTAKAIRVAKAAKERLGEMGAAPAELDDERAELMGLLGRAYKQKYVDHYGTDKVRTTDLTAAIDCYRGLDPQKWWWHGINAVACVARAARDGIAVPGIDDPGDYVRTTSRAIRRAIEARPLSEIQVWDMASATEACLASYLETGDDKDLEAAKKWLNRYVKYRGGNAFEYNSTLRQMVEVWQLKLDQLPGSRILPVLEGELLRHEGAFIETPLADLDSRRNALETAVTQDISQQDLQARFGREGAIRHKEWKNAEIRAFWVCKIHPYADEHNVKGTGLVVPGKALADSLQDQYYVLTNDHVVCQDATPYFQRKAPSGESLVPLSPDQAFVTCELARLSNLGVKRVVANSFYTELDFCLLELKEEFRPQLERVPDLEVARGLPPIPAMKEQAQRLYVIGYPGGSELAYSMSDNFIIDHEGPPNGKPHPENRVRLHYRSPTQKGSSGSPVFNQEWKVVGLHHAGGFLQQLNQKKGEHFANEGVWIQSIRALLS